MLSLLALLLLDDLGRTVALPAPPRRIVALAPSVAENLAFLGLSERVVGVTAFCRWPPELARRPKVGTFAHPELERILALRPDLVVATVQGNPRWAVEALERLGVPVYVTDVRGLRGLVRSLQRLARGLGCGGEAVERLRRSVEVPRPPPRRRVLLEVGGWPLVVAGPGSVQDELIRLAGGINVAAPIGRPYGRVCLEQALAWRPEVVLVSSMEGRARCRVALWRRLLPRARVVVVPSDLIDHPSPRALEALRLLRRWLR